MRSAAGILGLIAGIPQLLISVALLLTINWHGWTLPVLMLLGIVAIVGGFLAWSRPKATGVLLLVAGLGDVVVGLYSINRYAYTLLVLLSPIVLLILGGTLALAAKRET